MHPDKEQLVLENVGLARKLAWKYRWTGRDYDDLYQTGCLGLIKAAEGYEPGRGSAFSNYAWVCMENTLSGKPDVLQESLSLDAPLAEDEAGTFADQLADTATSPEDRAIAGHVHQLLG